MNTTSRAGVVFAAIAVMLLIFSLSLPWWTTHSEEPKYEGEGIREYSTRMPPFLLNPSQSSEYDVDNTTTTIRTTSWISTTGMIASTLSLLFLGMTISADDKRYKNIGSLLLLVGIIFALLAPIFLMGFYPGAVKNDRYGEDGELPDHDSPAKSFFGSYTEGETEQSWGGGTGWFFSIAGAVLLIVSLVLVMVAGSGRQRRRTQQPSFDYQNVPERDREKRQQFEEAEQTRQPTVEQGEQLPHQYCPQCGTKIEKGATYCSQCGTKVGTS